jgi:hypothetical protein
VSVNYYVLHRVLTATCQFQVHIAAPSSRHMHSAVISMASSRTCGTASHFRSHLCVSSPNKWPPPVLFLYTGHPRGNIQRNSHAPRRRQHCVLAWSHKMVSSVASCSWMRSFRRLRHSACTRPRRTSHWTSKPRCRARRARMSARSGVHEHAFDGVLPAATATYGRACEGRGQGALARS